MQIHPELQGKLQHPPKYLFIWEELTVGLRICNVIKFLNSTVMLRKYFHSLVAAPEAYLELCDCKLMRNLERGSLVRRRERPGR